MPEPLEELVVVGAGAAGLWAAGVAARAGLRVLLLEKTPRTGTKILASGGTRCNLTTTLGAREAAALFRREGERFLGSAFRALPPALVRERFDALGVPTDEAPLEKVFPRSQRARDVRDALEAEARAAGAEIRLNAPLVGIEPDEAGWRLRLGEGRQLCARQVMLCTGGRSYARTGTTGDGYAWLEALGLPLVAPVPALVPLTSPAPWVRELTGLALQEAELRAEGPSGKLLARRRRPLLFTHQGLSGPAAMDLSVHLARTAAEGGEAPRFLLDALPDHSRDELRARLMEGASRAGRPRLARLFPELPRRVTAAVLQQAGIAESNPPAAGLRKGERHALVETLKGMVVPVDGTRGYDHAEVTSGGLALRSVDPRSMRVNGCPGLFVFGELLDLDGPIGGLNFQAAFACAELAARAAVSASAAHPAG